MLIRAQNISLRHGDNIILDSVSLDIEENKVVTLIGPNGAGKSSLLRALLKLIKPTSGHIEHSPQLRIGYVPQRFTPDPMLPLNVKNFLALWPQKTPAIELLKTLGAEALYDRALVSLSGGELQRILLARALLNNPNLLVLDEPAQALDVQGQSLLYETIAVLKAEMKCGILMVSHDLHIVMGKTDHVVCLNKHVCCHGHPESIAQDPSFHALFGMMPSTYASPFALYHHHHDHAHDGACHVPEKLNTPSPCTRRDNHA